MAVVENQLWSDCRGVDTHGFQRVSWHINWFRDGSTDPKAQLNILQETPAVVVADGNHGLGQLVITRFMEHLIEVASSSGMVAGVIRNSNDWGCGANYPYKAAEAGFVCFGTTTSVPNLAPFGSRRKLFGNNPIVWTFPRREHPPIVLDMAMTPVALGKVLRARSEGANIPEAWGFLDRDGNPTIDPDVAMKGIASHRRLQGHWHDYCIKYLAMLWLDSHTGDVAYRRGHLLMNPEIFRDIDDYFDDIENMVQQIRSRRRGRFTGSTLYLPGEIEQNHGRAVSRGRCLLPRLSCALVATSEDVGVPFDCQEVN